MKIQCDVCGKAEAAVFCTADEAALCSACDHRVHHANKLASKHHRFSLLTPSSKQFPLCDICQEKRAFLFCQQDRAILCRDCDHPIHAANEHTRNHSRFLLTGVKLSNTSELYDNGSDSPAAGSVPDPKPKSGQPGPIATQPKAGNLETSSISEYLIETLPGWHVEDFLDNCKEDGFLMPFLGGEFDGHCNDNNTRSFSSENMGIWVPQAPPVIPQYPAEIGKAIPGNLKETNHRWSDDGSFTVPQMNFPSSGSKRSRTFW